MKNTMEIKFKAIPENEAFARNVVASFILPLNPSVNELEDIKTAVSEAVTNVIVHAYPDKKGYDKTGSKVNFTAGKVTTVTLGNSERGIPATAPKDLERSRVSPSGKLSGATTP